MFFERIFGPARIDSNSDGSEATIKLPTRSGGLQCQKVNYMLKVLQASATTNVRITVELQHGPDGTVTTTHSTAISNGDPGATFPSRLSGDCDSTKMVGEYLATFLKIKDNLGATARWAVVEVFEMRKPY